MVSKVLRLFVILGLILSISVAGTASANGNGTVTVIHGITGLVVDVYVNDELTLPGFEPGTITEPLSLPEGTYQIDIRLAGADPSSAPVLSGSASVVSGVNATIIAHLDGSGAPTISVFVNDISPISIGQTRVTVRHTAAAPAVDVRANGGVIINNFVNGQSATLDIPSGTYNVDVVPAGGTSPVIGPATLQLQEGTHYLIYAIGSLDQSNLDLLIQVIPGLLNAPDSIRDCLRQGWKDYEFRNQGECVRYVATGISQRPPRPPFFNR
jgi:hypothetical protein